MKAFVKQQPMLSVSGPRCCLRIFIVLVSMCSIVWISCRSAFHSATSAAVDRICCSSDVKDRATSNRSSTSWTSCRRRLFVRVPESARLGNRLFAHAALLGLAAEYGLQATLSDADDRQILTSVFNISTPVVPSVRRGHVWTVQCRWRTAVYVPPPTNMTAGAAPDDDIQVIGYLQSWRYFRNVEDRVRAEFRFREHIARQSARVIDQLTAKNVQPIGNGSRSTSVVRVGIHVRRSDMALEDQLKRGYTVADEGYIQRAISYVVERVKAGADAASTSLLFIVCTDDDRWARRHVRSFSHPVVFASSPRRNAAVDLAVLAACDHVITTVGTFSWWAGYLRRPGGMTIYYAGYPKPGTEIANEFNRTDFYPPDWIGLL